MNRLVDYPRFHAHYYTPNSRGRKPAPMGSFRLEFLTPLGRRALDLAREFIGRAEDYRGANRKGMYLKWEHDGGEDRELLLLLRDRLLDAGYNVEVFEKVLDQTPPRVPRHATRLAIT